MKNPVKLFLAIASIAGIANACVSDNLIRTLSSYRYSASAFCTNYLQSTIVETVIIPTTTFTTTVATVTPRTTVIITVTTVATLTVEVVSTYTTPLYPSPVKREIEARSVFIPPYLSYFNSYEISSGCSCFITPLPTPTYTTITDAIWTVEILATTTVPTLGVTTFSYTTETTTATHTSTTVVPNCAPIQGCIWPNSSWAATIASYEITNGLDCEYYCTGIGGILAWQLGITADGPACNCIGLAGWRAWDPVPGATGVAPGVGGGNCSDFWIYERACPFIPGYPSV